MNTLDIIYMLERIEGNLKSVRKTPSLCDSEIKCLLIRLYNETPLDYEEIETLWLEYLTKGSLSIATQIKNANARLWGIK